MCSCSIAASRGAVRLRIGEKRKLGDTNQTGQMPSNDVRLCASVS